MMIQWYDQRHMGPDNRPDRFEDRTFQVIVMLGGGGAVAPYRLESSCGEDAIRMQRTSVLCGWGC